MHSFKKLHNILQDAWYEWSRCYFDINFEELSLLNEK